ncbi:hypothetical protein M5D96_001408 [Drosophila gunungcola]|uniref:Uncharacterized protein n=1 Tax=Drosophila gunungcola TaxID=103775 RepID=A0A9P9YY27_9MUSC|nr:hypothetical protein M5D96_001408 [Drosophila gunungcola]
MRPRPFTRPTSRRSLISFTCLYKKHLATTKNRGEEQNDEANKRHNNFAEDKYVYIEEIARHGNASPTHTHTRTCDLGMPVCIGACGEERAWGID